MYHFYQPNLMYFISIARSSFSQNQRSDQLINLRRGQVLNLLRSRQLVQRYVPLYVERLHLLEAYHLTNLALSIFPVAANSSSNCKIITWSVCWWLKIISWYSLVFWFSLLFSQEQPTTQTPSKNPTIQPSKGPTEAPSMKPTVNVSKVLLDYLFFYCV